MANSERIMSIICILLIYVKFSNKIFIEKNSFDATKWSTLLAHHMLHKRKLNPTSNRRVPYSYSISRNGNIIRGLIQ